MRFYGSFWGRYWSLCVLMDSNGSLCVLIGPYVSLWVLVGLINLYSFLWMLLGP